MLGMHKHLFCYVELQDLSIKKNLQGKLRSTTSCLRKWQSYTRFIGYSTSCVVKLQSNWNCKSLTGVITRAETGRCSYAQQCQPKQHPLRQKGGVRTLAVGGKSGCNGAAAARLLPAALFLNTKKAHKATPTIASRAAPPMPPAMAPTLTFDFFVFFGGGPAHCKMLFSTVSCSTPEVPLNANNEFHPTVWPPHMQPPCF
jgi:hypothetical protein